MTTTATSIVLPITSRMSAIPGAWTITVRIDMFWQPENTRCAGTRTRDWRRSCAKSPFRTGSTGGETAPATIGPGGNVWQGLISPRNTLCGVHPEALHTCECRFSKIPIDTHKYPSIPWGIPMPIRGGYDGYTHRYPRVFVSEGN